MNVSEIRQRIFDQMDYFPDLQQYRDSVVRRLNDRYQELCDSAHWLFLQKEREITLRKAIEGSSTGPGIQVTSATNARKVTAVGFTPNLQMESQTLTNTTTSKEFTIIRVEEDTSSNPSTFHFFIDDDWDGTADGSTVFNWKITYQRFALPRDCIEVLSFTDRDADRGKLLYVNRRREEFAYLDADNTGDSSAVVEDEHITDDPPLNTPTFITVNSGAFTANNLLGSTTYEYKYTIYREGRESPPSLPVSVTTGAVANPTGPNQPIISLGNLDNTGFFATASSLTRTDSGMAKLIYRRDVTNDGKWMLVGSADSNSLVFTDQELHPKKAFSYQINPDFRFSNSTNVLRFEDSGPVQYVRFWYTPDTDKNIHIRYHYRPKDLIADNDAPVIPRQYHVVLVYMTLQDMFLQMQDTTQSQLYERRAALLLAQLRRRYLTRDDDRKRMQRWDRPRRNRNVYGTPTIN